MILNDYLAKLQDALEKKDKDTAFFQFHLMLQRDPLDQQGESAKALKALQTTWPESVPDDWEWNSLPDKDAEDRAWEIALGETLQLCEECPTVEMLERLKAAAEVLVQRGQLKRAVYPERTQRPQNLVQERKRTRTSVFSNKVSWFVSLFILFLLFLFFFLYQSRSQTKTSPQAKPPSQTKAPAQTKPSSQTSTPSNKRPQKKENAP